MTYTLLYAGVLIRMGRRPWLTAVVYRPHSFLVSAVSTAIVAASGFDAMTYDPTSTVFTFGSQGMNRTFETIKIMRDAVHQDLNGFVVFVTADFAFFIVLLLLHVYSECL